MASKLTIESWQQDLIDGLVMEVDLHFSHEEVSFERVRDYLNNNCVERCPNEQVALAIYNMYLDKLKKSGNRLCNKMNEIDK